MIQVWEPLRIPASSGSDAERIIGIVGSNSKTRNVRICGSYVKYEQLTWGESEDEDEFECFN